MAIKPESERENKKPVIDLQGPEGNAYNILGVAQQLAKDIGLDFQQIQKEMQSDDYEHLIETFDEYFGDYVDLQR